MRVVRCGTKVRDGLLCRPIEPSSTLHPLWPCRSSNRADLRFTQRRCVPAPPRPTPPSGTHWTWPVDDFHRIAQGHHRDASRPAFGTRSSAIARRAKQHNSFTAIALCVSHEQSETPQKACSKKVKIFKARRLLVIPLQFDYRGQGYEKRQAIMAPPNQINPSVVVISVPIQIEFASSVG
jgi:hypothetical protein